MKNKDMHVLDWSRIIQGAVKKREHGEIKAVDRNVNKGILFEDMVEKLLAAMFPQETWRRTHESHDGKRDFVYPAEEYSVEEKWAECKNYNDKISINVIAPTLIMSAIENIDCLLFFSYSPLNDNAIEGILRYSERKNTSVKIFDGNLLESLICKYHTADGIAEFFPNTDFKKAYNELREKGLRIIKTIRDLNGNIIPSTHVFELGELFCIHTVFQSLAWESMNCTISFEINNAKLLKAEANQEALLLPFAELKEYSILCETLRPGTVICSLTLAAKDLFEGKGRKTISRIKIIDEPYLAWSGKTAFRARIEALEHLSKYRKEPLIILGESGTGKSTLIEILLREKCVYGQYRIARIDLSLSRTNSVRSLFSQIIGINGKESTPIEQLNEDGKALSLLVEEYAESAEMIAMSLMRLYEYSRPYLFVLDNVQKISRTYITLFQELDDFAKRNNAPIYYLFALNEDDLSFDNLLVRLNWDAYYQNRECRAVKLTKFDTQDVLTYLKTKYGLQDIDKFFEGFEIEISPLELHSFCAALKKNRIIIHESTTRTYQIMNHFKFAEGVKHILYANASIANLCKTLGKDSLQEYILKYLYITGEIGYTIEKKYYRMVQNLINQGVLKEKCGSINFYHDKTREAIGRTLVFSEEDFADIFADRYTDNSSKAICALKQIGRIRGGNNFLRSYFISNERIEKMIQRYQICSLVFEHMSKLSELGLASVALQFVKNNFWSMNQEYGYVEFFQLLKCAADSALTYSWDIDEESVENMAYFIKKYFDRALSTYNYANLLSYFKECENVFLNLKYISPERRAFWLSHYANRAAIALDRISAPLMKEPQQVSDLYNLSHTYYEKAGFPQELNTQIIVDSFYRHYVYRHDLTEEIIQDTFKELSDIKSKGLIKSMVLEYHILLTDYLRCKVIDRNSGFLDKLLTNIKTTREICTSPFFTMKLLILEMYILMDLQRFTDVDNLLSTAYDYAYKREMRSCIYKLTYIKANLMIIQDRFDISPSAYSQTVLALEQLLDARGNETNDLKREIFLIIRLMKIISRKDPDRLRTLINLQKGDSRVLLQNLCTYLQTVSFKKDNLFEMQSYYNFEGINFPTI